MILIKDRLYNILKFCALLAFPAFGTLYFTLAGVWDLPAAEQVVSTVIAVDTFLGVILHLSSNAYNKGIADGGELHVDNENQMKFVLDEDKTDIETLGEKNEVRFKVKKDRKKSREQLP